MPKPDDALMPVRCRRYSLKGARARKAQDESIRVQSAALAIQVPNAFVLAVGDAKCDFSDRSVCTIALSSCRWRMLENASAKPVDWRPVL